MATRDTVTNPGTYKSAPRINIDGHGDGGADHRHADTWRWTDLAGGVIIDSELGECFDLDRDAMLKNSVVTLMDDGFSHARSRGRTSFPGRETGVTGITVTPRWRDL